MKTASLSPIPATPLAPARNLSFRVLVTLALICAVPALALALAADDQPAQATSAKSVKAHRRALAKSAKALTAPVVAAAPVAPPEPEAPHWPVNDKPVQATVTWDSQGLRVEAANASLSQILQDVSAATGTTVEGFESDQRVFGTYGPGPAREILSELLRGTGYNVVMTGDQGQGTPRELLLSTPKTTSTSSAAKSSANPNDEDADEDEQAGRPDAAQPNSAPPVLPRSPLQIRQQMLQRQQQMRGGPTQSTPPATPQN
jgi:hypothetical protein